MKPLALFSIFLATPAAADPQGYGQMMDPNYGHGVNMMFGPVLWIIVLGLVVAGVIWLVRGFDQGGYQTGKSKAITELDMRFARGEIDAEEYASRKKLLNA